MDGRMMKQGKVKLKARYGVVNLDDPHLQSPGALSLLTKNLAMQDEDYAHVRKWLDFRKAYLQKKLSWYPLECHYCKKAHLEIETDDEKMLATLDHVTPLSKGGGLYDEENLVVACSPCNQKKRDKDPVGRWQA